MKLTSLFLFLLFFIKLNCSSAKEDLENKGVFIISMESRGAEKNSPAVKFSDDSIFVNENIAVEKVMKINQLQYNDKIDFTESIGGYYLIDMKRKKFKDIGINLDKNTKQISWQPLKSKEIGHLFYYGWYDNEPYTFKDTVYEGKNIKKFSFTSKKDNFNYEVYLEKNLQHTNTPIFLLELKISLI